MDHILLILGITTAVLLSLWAAGHTLLYKRDSRAALVWTGINLTIPVIGPFLYWCLGINRISRRARSWQESGRRVSGTSIYPLDETHHAFAPLPAAASHLKNLRAMGDRVVTTPLRGGNLIRLLENGDNAYPAMLAAIRRARESINLTSYIFDADGAGADFVRELSAAADRGVEVRIIIDALGEKYGKVSPLKAFHGTRVHLVRYLPLRHGAYINLRNHRKLLIIDGREAFTGGMNICSKHVLATAAPKQAMMDLHFAVRGPVVADLQRSFLEDWFFVTGARLDMPLFFPLLSSPGNAVMRCISDGPDKEFRKLEQLIIGAISCASHSIYIMTPYFIPERAMISALITAALRGVEVRIVLPGRNNLPFVKWAGQALLWELIINGIQVYYQPPPFVHTKLMVIDDVWALIGSANLDARSLRLNFELNVSIFDADFALRMKAHFARAADSSQVITQHFLETRPLPIKLRDSLFHLFAPYL